MAIQLIRTAIKFFCATCSAAALAAAEPPRELLFDDGWLFHRGDTVTAHTPEFNDAGWRAVELPHDWTIEDIPGTDSPFDSTVVNGVSSGFTRGCTGWYRKHFRISNAEAEEMVHHLLFEGIYMNSDIWVNGTHLANHFYGYTPVEIDLTPYLKPDADNVVAVQVKTDSVTARWYSGSGIYRHVWLLSRRPVHLKTDGTSITSELTDNDNATVSITSEIANPEGAPATVTFSILDPAGRKVASATTSTSGTRAAGSIPVANPRLWSPDTPVLYTLQTSVSVDGLESDCRNERFGIRSLNFDPDRGFLLNGKPMKMRGGCIHSDNGPLGAKAIDQAEIRKIRLLKEAGFNALRMAHNPPSKAMLDACDSIGMLVIDEAFDVWRIGHFPTDYSTRFDRLWQRDLRSMVERDRNHPSVIMWSIGNEIKQNDTQEMAALADSLARFVRAIDPTRPVTAGVNSVSEAKDAYLRALDVAGYNYSPDKYVPGHKRNPGQLIYASESYSSQAADYWHHVERLPWVIGDFVWTAFDYIGEASIGWYGYDLRADFYPWNLAYCGDIDVCGKRRPQSFYRSTLWDKEPSVYISVVPPVPSFPLNPRKQKWSVWDWPDEVDLWKFPGQEGSPVSVAVYSPCDEVELWLNGRSLGRLQKDNNRTFNKFVWNTVYTPGALEAIGYNLGKEVARTTLATPSQGTQLKLTPERREILADANDLAYIGVALTDDGGRTDTSDDELVEFTVEGPGSLIAVGSSDPMSTESFTRPQRKLWRGECMVIVRPSGIPGDITVKARTASGKTSATTINATSQRITPTEQSHPTI